MTGIDFYVNKPHCTAAAQCGLFTHKSVPVIFEPHCTNLPFFYLFTTNKRTINNTTVNITRVFLYNIYSYMFRHFYVTITSGSLTFVPYQVI